jgi:hypothetical protein
MGFSLGGLISGAMKGVGEGMTTVAKGELENQQKELMRLTEEKDRRVAEFTDDLTRRGKIKDIEQVEPVKLAADVNRTTTIGGAETGVLVGREDALRPGKIKTAADSKTAELNVETDVTKLRGNDPNFLKAKQKLTDAGEGSAAKTTAEAARWKLGQEKGVADLRKQLSRSTDPDQRAVLTQQIQDLSGGSTKSYSDMVTAGDAFRKLAANLRAQLKDDVTLSETDQADLKQRIKLYEDQAASVLGTTVNRRLGGDAGQPGPGNPRRPAATSPAQVPPWQRDWVTPR